MRLRRAVVSLRNQVGNQSEADAKLGSIGGGSKTPIPLNELGWTPVGRGAHLATVASSTDK
jgi:hypothetical protein